MNCPNCGGLINLEKRYCEFCDTSFTEKELGLAEDVHTEKETHIQEESLAEPERKKTLTQQRQEELNREKSNRKTQPADTSAREIATGAAVLGAFGLFSGIRRFFRDLKRTVCLILLIALEIAFAFLMISGKVTDLMQGETEGFIVVNILILINALLAGLISRIGRIRAGTAITAIVNFFAVVWVFVYPLVATSFEGATAQSVALLAVIEMAVLAVSVLFSHLIYRR